MAATRCVCQHAVVAVPTITFALVLTALTLRPATSAFRDVCDTALAYVFACLAAACTARLQRGDASEARGAKVRGARSEERGSELADFGFHFAFEQWRTWAGDEGARQAEWCDRSMCDWLAFGDSAR